MSDNTNSSNSTGEDNLAENTIVDGIYSLGPRIGKGGMAVVFLAEADLTRFDYTTLYAYSQVHGNNHTERLNNAADFAEKLKKEELDIATIRKVLIAHGIPVPGNKVAVKVSRGDKALPRFEGEWKNLLCLNHENVIKVYGGGIYQGRAYYAMEYIENLCSPKLINEKFSIKQKLEIFIQACKGLQYLHDNGIIHRDVKPDNMIVCKTLNGELITKVCDLGIAKNVNEDLGLTVPNTVLGSPYYMSPEQIKSSSDVNYLTDIYSLGASLYEMVSGVSPYHDKTSIYQIINAVCLGGKPIPVKDHAPNLPDAIAGIIECAMSTDPPKRYQSIKDMQKDLETYLHDESINLTTSISFQKIDKSQSKAQVGSENYRFESIASSKEEEKVPAPAETNNAPQPSEEIPPIQKQAKFLSPANIIIAGSLTILLIIIVAVSAVFINKSLNSQTTVPSRETGKAPKVETSIKPSTKQAQSSIDHPGDLYRSLNHALTQVNPMYNGNLKLETLPNGKLDLRLDNCGISDISPLKGLNIIKLSCCDNKISDLSPISNAPLEELSCAGNQITSLSPLKGMKLKDLLCGNNRIKSLDPLTGMPLKALYIQNNEIVDLRPLRGLKLKILYACDNPIHDITPLAGMKLESLCISPTKITQGFEDLKNMESLRILAANKFEWMTKQDPAKFFERYASNK